ncbi:MAG: hypothetical protein KatS3mg076_1066 [Candidatus Binatia bacterium]|nr:MAG: hypothetical protein KatS3mg076_1066 [Candidatus Binatia bacterium]
MTRAEVAYHCSLALPEIDTHRLVEARGKAAEEFSRHLAFPEAAAELREVLRTIAAHPESFPPRLEFENRLELARALRRAGEPDEAQAVLREACVLARGLEEPELLAVALLPFATGIDAGQVDAEKVAWLEYALDRLPPEREDLRSRLLARLSWELYWSGDAERCLALSDEALRLARKRGDRWVLAQVLSERWFSSWGVLPVGERLELSEELASLARSLADPELLSRSYHGRVVDFLELGMGQRLASEIRAHAKDPLMRREPVHVWLAAIWKTTLSLLRGSFSRAGEDARAALELGKRAEPDNAAQAFFAHTYLLERARGFGEPFREGMEALARECPPALLVPVHAALASVMAESGEKEKAREAMEVALGSGLERGVLSMNWLPVLANLAEASWALRERRHAASLYARLEPARGRNVVLGPALGTLGPVDLYLGLLATLAGGFDEARGHFEKAGALARSLGSPPLVARVHCLFAEALAEARPANWQEEAGRSAERARVTASRLGMRAIGARAEGVLSGLRAPRASSRASPEDERVPNLFAREGEHWRVVYEGVALYVKDRRGMHYLALLLENPGREFYCLDLVQRVSGSAESIYDPPSTQPQVDPTARKAYQGRLRDLRAELAEAESASDLGRRESALEEIGWIEDELSRSAGLRGQRAEVPSAQERARVAVTKRIREAIREVGRQHAALGFHLRTTVKTGVTCVYVPPPGSPIAWHT